LKDVGEKEAVFIILTRGGKRDGKSPVDLIVRGRGINEGERKKKTVFDHRVKGWPPGLSTPMLTLKKKKFFTNV